MNDLLGGGHVEDLALAKAGGRALAQADDVEPAAAGELADERGHLVGADFYCRDDSVSRDHDEFSSWKV